VEGAVEYKMDPEIDDITTFQIETSSLRLQKNNFSLFITSSLNVATSPKTNI